MIKNYFFYKILLLFSFLPLMNNETDLDVYLLSLIDSLIIDNQEVTKDFSDIFEAINNILAENSSLFYVVNNSKFLEKGFLLCLRCEESFNEALDFFTFNIDNIIFPDLFYTKKFIFFITEKLYEKIYDNYNPILDFIQKFILKHESIISLLYECGFFSLLNSIIDTKTCKIYNTIFANRICTFNSDKKDTKMNKDCFYELHRKQFDSEIIFNENNIINFKTFNPFVQGFTIHNKIYEGLEHSSLYNLIEYDINEMDWVINFKKNDYKDILNVEDVLQGCYDKKITFIRMARMYLSDTKEMKDRNFLKKLCKFLDDKDYLLRYEVLLILSQQEIVVNLNEKKIRAIFGMLEYNITECTKCSENGDNELSTEDGGECDGECTLLCILDMLYQIYLSHNKLYFYKISYLIILKELSKRVGHIFIAEYLKDIIMYFKENKNNISRVLFPYQTKITAKNESENNLNTEDLLDKKEILNIEDHSETENNLIK